MSHYSYYGLDLAIVHYYSMCAAGATRGHFCSEFDSGQSKQCAKNLRNSSFTYGFCPDSNLEHFRV